jgi:hypothetical protein
MFESRLQLAQFFLIGAGLCIGAAIIGFLSHTIVVGLFFLFFEHVLAAIGCFVYAEDKGYPPIIGLPIGIGLGVMGAALIAVLPDESDDGELARKLRLSRGAEENARRDPGYEVLDDEDD